MEKSSLSKKNSLYRKEQNKIILFVKMTPEYYQWFPGRVQFAYRKGQRQFVTAFIKYENFGCPIMKINKPFFK